MSNLDNITKAAQSIVSDFRDTAETVKELNDSSNELVQNANENASSTDGQDTMLIIPKEGITTSKAVLWSVLIFTALMFAAGAAIYVIFNKNISFIYGYVVSIASPVTLGYQAKSYLENKNKYK